MSTLSVDRQVYAAQRLIGNEEGVFMGWPQDEKWYALIEGEVEIVDCGELVAPTGRLLICDPYCYLKSADPTAGFRVVVPPGRYPVKASMMGTDVAYLSLLVRQGPEVTRRELIGPPGGVVPDGYAEDDFDAFPVETATACVVDEGAIDSGMPSDPSRWDADVFFTDEMIERRKANNPSAQPAGAASADRLADGERWISLLTRQRVVNTKLPAAPEGGPNIILAYTHHDGGYGVVGGYDERGNLAVIHIDLFGPPEEEDEE